MTLAAAAQADCEGRLRRLVADGRLPGVVAAVFSPAGLAWQGRVGLTRRYYRIGSLTKTFTAVAVLQLRELGLVDLRDPVADHVADSPYPRATLHDLLAHSSGLTAEPVGPWWERSSGVEWEQLARAHSSGVEVFRPGERYHYSNLGYALLGEVVSRHRATTWYNAVRLHILQPLGLCETAYHPGGDAAEGTSRDPRTGRLMAEPAVDTMAMAPAGQLWSTAADLARWGSFLVGGDDAVLPPAKILEMRTAQSADPDLQHLGAYGLGLRLRWRPSSTLVGHTGSMPGFLAATFADSVSGVGAVVLTNATTGLTPERVAAELVDLAEPHLLVAASPPHAPAAAPGATASTDRSPASELAGEWYWGNTALRLLPMTGGFMLLSGDERRTFRCLGSDTYVGLDGYYAGERLEVLRRADGSVSHLEVVTFVLTRVPYDPTAPIPGGPPDEVLSSPG